MTLNLQDYISPQNLSNTYKIVISMLCNIQRDEKNFMDLWEKNVQIHKGCARLQYSARKRWLSWGGFSQTLTPVIQQQYLIIGAELCQSTARFNTVKHRIKPIAYLLGKAALTVSAQANETKTGESG